MFDLVLKRGRAVDPAQGQDAVLDGAFAALAPTRHGRA